jgi:hypothetical protein
VKKTSLDIFSLKYERLEELDNLPDPDVIAQRERQIINTMIHHKTS